MVYIPTEIDSEVSIIVSYNESFTVTLLFAVSQLATVGIDAPIILDQDLFNTDLIDFKVGIRASKYSTKRLLVTLLLISTTTREFSHAVFGIWYWTMN